ncbi:MAG: hypothetical protein ACOC0S_00440 [Desulfohalobiaceae bacterium]
MKRLIKYLLLFTLLVVVLGTISAAGIYYWAARDLPRMQKITDYSPALTSTVYARDGQVLGHLSRENRFLVSLHEMAPSVPLAFWRLRIALFMSTLGWTSLVLCEPLCAIFKPGL